MVPHNSKVLQQSAGKHALPTLVRHAIRLPPVLSSFGDVHKASLSNFRALHPSLTMPTSDDNA
eukprot:1859457-Heterocapsa_arctica.AAC.1